MNLGNNGNTEQANEQMELQKQILQLENNVKPYFSKEALSRYSNLKAGHPEKAVQALLFLFQGIQSGSIKGVIDDNIFKGLLMQMQTKKEFNIRKK